MGSDGSTVCRARSIAGVVRLCEHYIVFFTTFDGGVMAAKTAPSDSAAACFERIAAMPQCAEAELRGRRQGRDAPVS